MSAGNALQGLGAAIDFFGSIDSTKKQSQAMADQAGVAISNARLAIQKARQDADAHAIQSQLVMASGQAEYSASNVEGGSVDAVMAASATNAEMDRLNILYGGDIKSKNFMSEAHRLTTAISDVRGAGLFSALSAVVKGTASASKFGGSTTAPTTAPTDPEDT